MSLLLEALKRAERAKKQQNIEEITAAMEEQGLDPSAPPELPPAESIEAAPLLLDLPALEPTVPTAAPAIRVSPTEDNNTLEFKLEPFDLPPLEAPSVENEQPVVMEAASVALDWSAVELSPH